ncbi:hypothetical protein K8U55_12590 [Klebsiella pneumoniae]|uniref:hypothetical protein n=1 Tax=Klebsiella pneumoniae TaxID=573 RepID=UPI001CF98213|nr:hypothetical protein [Klebsiella pneumoniae]UCZ68341.1 hypothetical protein K8U55_12590 [Klebsiella pneumoniae]
MQAIGFIVYIVVGLFQLAAIMAGLESWWGLHWIIAAPIAFIISYIPLVGSIVGMVGAMDVWRWEWWQAGLLFFGGLVFCYCLRRDVFVLRMAILQEKSVTCHNATHQIARYAGY